jgi:hypothetical protein
MLEEVIHIVTSALQRFTFKQQFLYNTAGHRNYRKLILSNSYTKIHCTSTVKSINIRRLMEGGVINMEYQMAYVPNSMLE